MEYPWGHTRRFNAYAQYFEKEFGARVQKVTIDAGFTCPNRDGTKGHGGCTYCNNEAFNPSYCSPEKTIKQQISEGIEFHKNRYRRAEKFLAYFQAYSNTYDSLENLKRRYDQALEIENVVGLVIGTRPDCIDEEKLRYFSDIAKTHYVIIEYGLESCYDESLVKINRGHTFQESKDALELTASFGLKTGAHIIFGLPGETKQMMITEAAILSKLPLTTLKLHQLQIVKDTKMAKEFIADPGQFTFLGLEEYIDLVIHFIENLSPTIVIERFAGEVPPRFLAGPNWGVLRYDQILQKIEKMLIKRNSWQGKAFIEP
ncbi:MAG: TIGR01212 family radical SAM protein [Bacteroidales bacterium]|nr:TIGR01212 family radical SAM protein [Bacteroidales bacterium]